MPVISALAALTLAACGKPPRTETDDRQAARQKLQARCVAMASIARNVDRQKYAGFCACQADRVSAEIRVADLKVLLQEGEVVRPAQELLDAHGKVCLAENGLS